MLGKLQILKLDSPATSGFIYNKSLKEELSIISQEDFIKDILNPKKVKVKEFIEDLRKSLETSDYSPFTHINKNDIKRKAFKLLSINVNGVVDKTYIAYIGYTKEELENYFSNICINACKNVNNITQQLGSLTNYVKKGLKKEDFEKWMVEALSLIIRYNGVKIDIKDVYKKYATFGTKINEKFQNIHNKIKDYQDKRNNSDIKLRPSFEELDDDEKRNLVLTLLRGRD